MITSKNIIEFDNQSVMDVFRTQYETPIKLTVLVESEKLIGVVSDGDIRRFILKGGSFESPILDVIRKDPITAGSRAEATEIKKMHPELTAIPVVDENRMIIELYIDGKPVFKPIGMPVVINAGGRGTRLDPYTRILPKPLIPIGDLPVIELIMQEFKKYNCNTFSIILNYKGQMIKAYFSDEDSSQKISWVDEDEPLGTGGGLRLLRGTYDETFFFTNCDTLIRTDYAGIVSQHQKEGNKVTVVSACKNMKIPYGVIETEDGGRIREIVEKPEMSFMTNVGMYVVEPDVIDVIGDNEAIDFTDVITRLLEKGEKVGVYPISEDEWLDMGKPDELERMRKMLEEDQRKQPKEAAYGRVFV